MKDAGMTVNHKKDIIGYLKKVGLWDFQLPSQSEMLDSYEGKYAFSEVQQNTAASQIASSPMDLKSSVKEFYHLFIL